MFEQRDETLRAAQVAARRLLVRAIDLRFDLDDTVDQARLADPMSWADLTQLRADSDAVRVEIDRLAELLLRSASGHGGELDDVEEAMPAAHV